MSKELYIVRHEVTFVKDYFVYANSPGEAYELADDAFDGTVDGYDYADSEGWASTVKEEGLENDVGDILNPEDKR